MGTVERVRVGAEHRVDRVSRHGREVRVVDAGRAQVGDPGVAAVVRPDGSRRSLGFGPAPR